VGRALEVLLGAVELVEASVCIAGRMRASMNQLDF
jgi:hypothetical protein